MTALSTEAYALAWMMFQRRCTLDGADPALVELAWLDDDIRAFWLDEAQAVLDYQAAERKARPRKAGCW